MFDWLTFVLYVAGALAVVLLAYEVLKPSDGGQSPRGPGEGSGAGETPSEY